MPVVFAWAKKPPLCKGGTDRRRWSGGIERSGGRTGPVPGHPNGAAAPSNAPRTNWRSRLHNPSVGVRRQLPLHKGALFAFLQPTCPVRERSMTAQALGRPWFCTGPGLDQSPCRRSRSTEGRKPYGRGEYGRGSPPPATRRLPSAGAQYDCPGTGPPLRFNCNTIVIPLPFLVKGAFRPWGCALCPTFCTPCALSSPLCFVFGR